MDSTERITTYAEAIREATVQEMARDPAVRVLGICVDDHRGFYKTLVGLADEFGAERVWGTPLSEDALTGYAIGSALAGGRPILAHERFEYTLLGANQLINIAAKARYMFGGSVSLPMVVRAVIGRSWGQGAQHSQGLHSLYMHIPGLKVVAPSTPYDAKGCLATAIRDNNPVIFIEQRMLHFLKGHVPEESYTVPFGKARVLRTGTDLTLVGISYMVAECLRAAHLLEAVGVSAEVIDPVSLSPLDMDTIASSVVKTKRLLAVDTAWTFSGATAEIVSQTIERLQGHATVRVARMGFAPVPCPPTKSLENLFYPNPKTIAIQAEGMVRGMGSGWVPESDPSPELVEFRGPF